MEIPSYIDTIQHQKYRNKLSNSCAISAKKYRGTKLSIEIVFSRIHDYLELYPTDEKTLDKRRKEAETKNELIKKYFKKSQN
jgi:hypothetical protein